MVLGLLSYKTSTSDEPPISLDRENKMSSQTVASCLIFSSILVFYFFLLSFHLFLFHSFKCLNLQSDGEWRDTSADVQSFWRVTPRSSSSNRTAVLPPVALLNWEILFQILHKTLQVSRYSSSDQQQLDLYIWPNCLDSPLPSRGRPGARREMNRHCCLRETSKTCQMSLLVEEPVSFHWLGGEGRAASSSLREGELLLAFCGGSDCESVLCMVWRPTMLIAHKTCHFTIKKYLCSSQFFDVIGNIYQFPKVPVCHLPDNVCSDFVREP